MCLRFKTSTNFRDIISHSGMIVNLQRMLDSLDPSAGDRLDDPALEVCVWNTRYTTNPLSDIATPSARKCTRRPSPFNLKLSL